MGFGGSSGGSFNLAGATDIALSNPTNTQVLGYNSTTSKWSNANSTNPMAGITGAKIIVTQDFTTAGTARSTSRTDVTVRWRGPVEPTNMLIGDEWYVTA